jgi:pantoate--beta-alanine ligase
MQIARTVAEMRRLRAAMQGNVGLVPTMGFLHEGHLSLVARARKDNDHAAASIFVNPTQFGPNEDLSRYPRDMERDLALLKQAGVDVVFAPDVADVYPPGFNTYIEVGGVTEPLEGAHRPGHFRGVATVVAKLFNIVQPHRAYFGEKDAQQLLVIRTMVRDLDIAVEVVPMPTVREPDGLALSSRNVYLSPPERQAATVLIRSLGLAQSLVAGGQRDAEQVRAAMRALIAQEPLATIDYVSIADAETLQELDEIDRPALASLAVRIGATRLIDNIRVMPQ